MRPLKKFFRAEDTMSTLQCTDWRSSADSEVWEHPRPSAHTAVTGRAKGPRTSTLELRGPPQQRVGSGSPQGARPDGPTPAGRAAHQPAVSTKQGKAGGSHGQELGTQVAQPRQPATELETWINPYLLSHSKKLVYKKLLCY